MKNILKHYILGLFLFVANNASSQHTHTHADGTVHEGHSHGIETELEVAPSFSTEVADDNYELLLRYESITPGEEAHLTLFVSDYATNAPMDDVSLQLVLREDVRNVLKLKKKSVGIWEVTGVFKDARTYSIAALVKGVHGESNMLLNDIHVGLDSASADEHHHHWYTAPWFVAIISCLGGMLLLIFLQRTLGKRSGRAAAIAGMIFIVIPYKPQISYAHEGHDHGEEKKKTGLGNDFDVQKETQFLLDVLTQQIKEGAEVMTQSFFGTVLPASQGQAVITAPQTGRIVSLNTSVGSNIQAGQVLAVMEGFIDAASSMTIQAERNNLQAEVEAAFKELERLKSIADIVAKKDIDEAAARYAKAKDNLELFKGKSGGRIELKAPISGVIDNFTLSIGSSVTQSEILFTVVNPSVVYVDAQVYGDASAIVASAKEFVVVTNTGKQLPAKLLALPQTLHPGNQSQHVMFEIENSSKTLKIGEYVTMKAMTPTGKETIIIPASAITEVDGKSSVFVKNTAEKFELRTVNISGESNAVVNVTKGIQYGDRVVVNATYQVKMAYLNR